jgi:hypothetical protein
MVVPSRPLLALVLLASTGPGCDWIPVRRRLDPKLYPVSASREQIPPPRADPEVATASASVVLPPLPHLIPVSDAEALRSPAPTPLLDAALARASEIREATLQTHSEPTDEPAPAPRVRLPDTPPAVATTPEPATLDPDLLLAAAQAPPAEDPGPPPLVPEPGPGLEAEFPPPPADPPAPAPPSAPATDLRPASAWQEVVQALEATAATVAPNPEAPEAPAFRVSNLRLCREVSGFGSYQPLSASVCRADQQVIVYFEVEGVSYTAEGDRFSSHLDSAIELVRSDTGQAVWSERKPLRESDCPRPRRDYFVGYPARLPDNLLPGRYILRVRQTDIATGHSSEGELALSVLR